MAAAALGAVDNGREHLIIHIGGDVVEFDIGIERCKDHPGHLSIFGGVVDVRMALGKVEVMEGCELGKHHIAVAVNNRNGGVVGPVVSEQNGIAGKFRRFAEAGSGRGIDNAVAADLLIKVTIDVIMGLDAVALVDDAIVVKHRIVDIGTGNSQPALHIPVDRLMSGDIDLPASVHNSGIVNRTDVRFPSDSTRGSERGHRAENKQRRENECHHLLCPMHSARHLSIS